MKEPKDKAAEFVEKFENVGSFSPNEAIDCAKIAVEEILNNDGFTQFDQYLTEYWQQVRLELDKL